MNDKDRLVRQLEMSLKYDMFTTLDGESVDDRIMCLSDTEFEQLKSVFKNRIEFFEAIGEAGRYAHKGQDVPDKLWQGIVITRKAYEQTIQQ